MQSKSIYIIPLIFLFITFIGTPSANIKTVINPNLYFPVKNNVTLVYKSSFGESVTKYSQDGEFITSSSKANKFKYRQTLIIKNDGVYCKETYEFLKIFLFIKKEGTFTYSKPLLRFPLPLTPGMKWEWQGDEYSNGDTNKVKIKGRVIDKEIVNTKAGRFEAIKLESVVEGSSNSKNTVTEWYVPDIGLIKAKIIIEGGGMMGFVRDILGYGTIEFELQEITSQ